ncbi:MAG: Type 1 glutamine amidotransferase-like domain-containing protein [Chloroflexi bacterium]|nr:Type 1 glutamine amidotransferase-like domain-containing protein [Chloroflexota bacterium]
MQPGPLLLAGSGEFRPPMTAVDAELLRHTPGRPPKVAILPTAAGQEDVSSWIRDGIAHFTALGCEAYGVRALDRPGVEAAEHVAALEAADLIYLSGGSPGYLVETLRGSVVWDAIRRVWRRGGALAGSSAGAMALGERTLVRREGQIGRMPAHWDDGLNLLPEIGVIPHYDRFGLERTNARVAEAPSGLVVLGIDEDTVILCTAGRVRVLGHGTVTVWHDGFSTRLAAGSMISATLAPLP